MRVSSLTVAVAAGLGSVSLTNAQLAEPMIVGGKPSDVLEYPYYVDLNGCGASLIAPGVVLSAAHCVDGGVSYVNVPVIVGGYDRQQVTNGAVSATVTEQLVHPSWDTWAGMDFDIMLFKLDSPVTTSGTVKLALNSQFSTPSSGQVLTIIGNGNTQEDGAQSDILLEAEVLAIDTETCNEPYQGEVVDEVMFCAGDKGKDTCQGDSGGPIVVVNGDTHTQVGVVSWGYGCSRPGIPGVYARVSSVMSWIAHVTCTCWGVDDADICSFLDSNDNFSCEDTGGGDRPGGDTGSGPSGCEIVAGWVDNFGDGCGWFEEYDEAGCPETGYISGPDGVSAWEACCHCEDGGGEPDGCLVIAGWVDAFDDSCGWYETNDSAGCPNFGGVTSTDGATAWEACCHCEGGGSGSTGDEPGCQLVDGWVDAAGDGCGWYEQNDLQGCPTYGSFQGPNGVAAWDACCHCEGGRPSGCELVSGWTDSSGDTCAWYEDNEEEGCPMYGAIRGTNNIAAWEACCHCDGGRPDTSGPGCQLVDGWVDIDGDSCKWYEVEDTEGCPTYGNAESFDGVPAWQACCHCGGNSSVVDGCQLISGWLDELGGSCGHYEARDSPGCPIEGDTVGTGGATANEACCHCAGVETSAPLPGGNPTMAPVSDATPPTPVPDASTPTPAPVPDAATPTNSPANTNPGDADSSASHWNFSVTIGLLSSLLFIISLTQI